MPINPFRSNKIPVGDTVYTVAPSTTPRQNHHHHYLAKQEGEIVSHKKSSKARSKSSCVLYSTGILLFSTMILLFLGTRVLGTQSHHRLGLSLCYSARFLCGLPKSMLPINVVPLCELASQMHDYNPDGLCFGRCTVLPSDKPEGSVATGLTVSSAIPNPAPAIFQHNFAAREKGSVIIPVFTSPTHKLPPPTIAAHIILALTGYTTHYPDIMRPSILLDEHVVDGECWEFSAIDGRIGIQLSERIAISHISLNYIPAEQLSPHAASKAPQDVSIWGLIEDRNVSQTIAAGVPVHKVESFLQDGRLRLPSFINPESQVFIQLAKFRYNMSSIPWQQFSVTSSLAQVPNIQTIIAAFETNKGASTTCIYTIGIHGTPT